MAGEDHTHIVGSVDGRLVVHAEYNGRRAIDCAEDLFAALERRGDTAAISLFALPEAAFSRIHKRTIVTWYGDRPSAAPLSTLSGDARDEAEQALRASLARLLADPDPHFIGLLTACLNLHAPASLLVAEGRPMIAGWGMVPAEAAADAEAYRRHVAATLAAFLPAGFVPGLGVGDAGAAAHSGAEPAPAPAGMAAAAGGAALAAAPADDAVVPDPAVPDAVSAETPAHDAATGDVVPGEVTAEPAAGAPAPPPGPAAAANGRARLVPLGLGLLLMVLFLAYALWPGHLVYPEQRTALLPDEAAAQRGHNAALETEIRRLQDALSTDNVCLATDNGLPLGRTLPPDGPPLPGGTAPPPAVPGALPNAANRSAPAAQEGAGQPRLSTRDLVRRLDEATVFIVGATGEGVSTGSGFFVSPRHILTNRHVVEETAGHPIVIANKRMQRPVPARLVGTTASSAIGGSDFALLEVTEAIDPPAPLAFAEGVERLGAVVAAGFPAFVIQTDPSFVASFRGGDFSRLHDVQMAVTEGIVTQTQPGNNGATVIAHSATISSGNSGGPLIDRCGRVVGVNTFVRTDAENALRLNLALSAPDAVAFLAQHGLAVDMQRTPCSEMLAADAPPAAAGRPAPAPGAAAGTPVPAAPAVPPGAAAPRPSVPQAPNAGPKPAPPPAAAAPPTGPAAAPPPLDSGPDPDVLQLLDGPPP